MLGIRRQEVLTVRNRGNLKFYLNCRRADFRLSPHLRTYNLKPTTKNFPLLLRRHLEEKIETEEKENDVRRPRRYQRRQLPHASHGL